MDGCGQHWRKSAIHIVLLPDKTGIQNWSTGSGCIAFYRRIAPLERKTERFSLNRKLIDLQWLATRVDLLSNPK